MALIRYEGIVDTFVQLFLSHISSMIASFGSDR